LKELLACRCDCPSGSEGLDRHSCVHCLVKPFQLSVLLYNGLAENILIELPIRLQSVSTDLLHPLEDRFKIAINGLMHAAGLHLSRFSSTSSVLEMLNILAMLTDIAKTALNPPKLEDLGLICDKVLQMPEMAISKQIKKNQCRQESVHLIWTNKLWMHRKKALVTIIIKQDCFAMLYLSFVKINTSIYAVKVKDDESQLAFA